MLHHGDFRLDLKTTLVLPDDFLLELCACLGAFLGLIEASLVLSLLLLVSHHLLNASGLKLLLLFLHVYEFLLFAFFHFQSLGLIELLLKKLLLSHLNSLLNVVLHVLVPF